MKRNNKNKAKRHYKILANNIVNYFIINNKRCDKEDKENIARYRLYKLFDKHFFNKNKKTGWKEFYKDLISVQREVNYLFRLAKTFEKREDWEFYKGFTEGVTEEFIQNECCYICDRWNSASRLNFLVNVIEWGGGEDVGVGE